MRVERGKYPQDWVASPGISDSQILELIFLSQTDELVKKHTSDLERFKNFEDVKTWATKRAVYTLKSNDSQLLGLIWFSQEDIPQALFTENFDRSSFTRTFAIRMYGQARGGGYALKFMENCFRDFWEKSGIEEGIWLEVSNNNKPALKLYRNFGFRKISVPDENNKILMILR